MKVNESIFDGPTSVIPMADVQHVEKHWFPADERTRANYRGIQVITKHTKWSQEMDYWENPIYLPKEEADQFLKAFSLYRYELEN